METMGVSIIVPVYNVEKYLEQCLDSVCGQKTNYNYEIILVNDGSTDTSGEICRRWCKRDERIRYFEKENEGLGPTRNFGIQKSAYKYITFLDSDDWLDETYVERMLSCIEKEKADIVYCDCCYYSDKEGKTTRDYFRSNLQKIDADIKQRMAYGYPNMWGAVYKKELWEEHDLRMPAMIYEDTAVYGVILSYANRICAVDAALYFYRVGRQGSLMQIGSKDVGLMIKALRHLIEFANEKGVFEKNREAFMDFCVRQLEVEWDNRFRNVDDRGQKEIKTLFSDFLNTNFPLWESCYCQNVVSIGSYNTGAVHNRVKLFREVSQNKYPFSSLIGLMSRPVPEDCYFLGGQTTRFRREVIRKEMENQCLEKIGNDRLILLDFLDEWNDIIQIGDQYINKTEASDEVVVFKREVRVIPRNSEECTELWKDSCSRFVDWARENNNRIVLLKLYFNKVYGDESQKELFDCQERIEKVNAMLSMYYNYFEEISPESIVVELEPEYCFTDRKFPFGCKPYHYNTFAYYLLAYKVLGQIRKVK